MRLKIKILFQEVTYLQLTLCNLHETLIVTPE